VWQQSIEARHSDRFLVSLAH